MKRDSGFCSAVVSLLWVMMAAPQASAQLEPPPPPTAPAAEGTPAAAPADEDAPLPPADPPPAAGATSPGDPEEVLPPGTVGPAADDVGLAAAAAPPLHDGLAGEDPDPGRTLLTLPSLFGSVGLFKVSSADTGRARQLRLGLHGEFFTADGVLVERDENLRLQGALTLGYTPFDGLELFGAFLGGSNRNLRQCENGVCRSEEGRRDPEVIKAFGDIILGGKYSHGLAPGFRLGGETYLRLLSSISGVALDPSATSVSLKGLGSVDARAFSRLPLRGHVNVGYYLDNSDSLQNYVGVPPASRLVSSFAYGIGRSRVQTALAVDAPLPALGSDIRLHPFAEYHLEVVTGKSDATFSGYMPPACGRAGALPCRDNRDQQWLTIGVRALLWGRVALDVGVEAALRSVGFPYGTPLAPYNLVFGASLPLDLGALSRPPRVVTRTVTVEKTVTAERAEGVVTGSVVSANGGAPLAGAVVAVVGRPHARVASDPDGGFTSHPLPPGEIDIEISAEGHEPQSVRAEIAAGMSTDVRVALVPVPQTRAVAVRGQLKNTQGRALAGVLRFSGPSARTVTADAAGQFEAELEPGSYSIIAEAEGHLRRASRIVVRDDAPAVADFSLPTRPSTAAVDLSGKTVLVRRPIRFGGGPNATALSERSRAVLDELADLMLREENIRMLIIETHWDSAVGRDQALLLTEKQADAIADYLRDLGVTPDRLRTVPKGASEPRVPNIGSKNRRKNQRVVFSVERG